MNEPENRVSLEKPNKKISYNIIDKVRFITDNKNFSNQWIDLNADLNALIGGKSSGKSLLLYLIARTILKEEKLSEKNIDYDLERLEIKDFEVKWKDGNSDFLSEKSKGSRNITYIPQLYLNNIVEKNRSELDKVILQLVLENKELRKKYEEFEVEKEEREKNIDEYIKFFISKLNQKESEEDKILEFPTKEAIEKEIGDLLNENEKLKKNSILNDEEDIKYNSLKEKINILNEKILKQENNVKNFEEFSNEMENYKIYLESGYNKINKKLEELDFPLKEKIIEKLKEITRNAESLFKDYLVLGEEISQNIINNKKDTEIEVQSIEKELIPLEEKLKEINFIKENENKIKTEEKKLNERLAKEKIITDITLEIEDILKKIRRELFLLRKAYEKMKNSFSEYKKISDNLELDVQIYFDSSKFEERIEQILDKRQSFDKIFDGFFEENKFIYNYEENEKNILELIKKIIDKKDEFKLKRGCSYSELVMAIAKNYYYFNYDLRQNNDTLSAMSQGKRGLILFQLYLQFSSAEFPVLIDQPEDNLDNRTVYKELKDFIIKKKKERQIIMVTHNANLVVPTDAEEIIVANQAGENGKTENLEYRFEYVSGALENSFLNPEGKGILYQKGIKEHVCEILEGGEEAFRQRNIKYKIIN